MTGAHPTVGCLVLSDKTTKRAAIAEAQKGFRTLIPQGSWQVTGNRAPFALAAIGPSQLEVIILAQKTEDGIFVFLCFDEDEVVHLSRRTGILAAELLSPYVAAMETLPSSKAIGIGYEMSSPEGMQDEYLRDAGIAVLFLRNDDGTKWERKELLPMIGHYL